MLGMMKVTSMRVNVKIFYYCEAICGRRGSPYPLPALARRRTIIKLCDFGTSGCRRMPKEIILQKSGAEGKYPANLRKPEPKESEVQA